MVSCMLIAVMAVLLVPTLVSGETLAPTGSPAAMVQESAAVAYTSVEQAQQAVQIDLRAPQNMPEGTALTAVRVVDGNILELEYQVGKTTVMFRTAKGNDDISGVTKDYTFTTSEEQNGVVRSYAGITEKVLSLAVWACDGHTYAVVAEGGISADLMRQIAESVM